MKKFTKVTVTATAALGAMFAASADAEASSNQARNRCSDAITILRSNPSQQDMSKEIEPMEAANFLRHFNQVVEGWNRADGQLKQIPKGELESGASDLADCNAEITKWRTYITVMKPKLVAALELAKKVEPFLAEVKSHENAVRRFVPVALKPDADIFEGLKAPQVKALLDELAEVEKGCVKLPDAGQIAPVESRDDTRFYKRPANWCYVAVHRTDLATQASANRRHFVEGYGAHWMALPAALQNYSPERPVLEPWLGMIAIEPEPFLAKLRATAVAWHQDLGLTPLPSATDTSGVEAQIKALQAKIDQVAPQVAGPTATAHSAAIEGMARAAIVKIFPQARVRQTAMVSPDWTITTNDVGIPTDRFRTGRIVFKQPKAKWCEERDFSYVESYAGGGRYQSSSTAQILGGTKFFACK